MSCHPLHPIWSGFAILVTIVATLSFGTSTWFVNPNAEAVLPHTFENSKIECGPMVYCIKGEASDGSKYQNEFEQQDICSNRYGGSFTGIPFSEWRIAAALAIAALILSWIYAGMSLITMCCARRYIKSMRGMAPVVSALLIASLVFTWRGLEKLNPHNHTQATNGAQLCVMCEGATMFSTGDCVLGWSAVAAITATVGSVIVSAIGYVVPHKYGQIHPDIIEVLQTGDLDLQINGRSHEAARKALRKPNSSQRATTAWG
eukprot:m.78955 g.78955  ORF g.78955 m.78955 type:complete len:260 (+) comp25165_c0_seq1:483-1262(+)